MPTPSVPEHVAWREGYERALSGPRGWWATTGVHWLGDGVHLVGSDPASTVLLAAGTPRHVGTIERDGFDVTVTPATAAGRRHGGASVAEPLTFTVSKEGHAFTLGPATFVVLRRQDRVGVRTYDATAPARRTGPDVAWFGYDPTLVVEARFVRATERRSVPIVYAMGEADDVDVPGHLEFEIAGSACRLTPFASSTGLHLVFRDLTSSATTYGAGRFLMTEPPVDGRVVLDFNRAFHPPCAHSAHASCPIAPIENHLRVAIEAGERTPT
jgi:uncharacterized protein